MRAAGYTKLCSACAEDNSLHVQINPQIWVTVMIHRIINKPAFTSIGRVSQCQLKGGGQDVVSLNKARSKLNLLRTMPYFVCCGSNDASARKIMLKCIDLGNEVAVCATQIE